MTDIASVPVPVSQFVEAINTADTDAFVALFTTDGFVNDWGRVLDGHDGVRSWAGSDAIGMGAQMELLTVDVDGDTVTTTFSWVSRRFTGESSGIFTLAGDKISGFTIPPHS